MIVTDLFPFVALSSLFWQEVWLVVTACLIAEHLVWQMRYSNIYAVFVIGKKGKLRGREMDCAGCFHECACISICHFGRVKIAELTSDLFKVKVTLSLCMP
jgi:hypothetical protein